MKNEADEKSLTEITEADLIAMGIDAFFTRKKIMKRIKSTVRKINVSKMILVLGV